jgi:hypothetical protein
MRGFLCMSRRCAIVFLSAYGSLYAQPSAPGCEVVPDKSYRLRTSEGHAVWLQATSAARYGDGVVLVGIQTHVWATDESEPSHRPVRLRQSDSILGFVVRRSDWRLATITNPVVGKRLRNVQVVATDDGSLHVILAAMTHASAAGGAAKAFIELWYGKWRSGAWHHARRIGTVSGTDLPPVQSSQLVSRGSALAFAHSDGDLPLAIILWSSRDSVWRSDTLRQLPLISHLALDGLDAQGWQVYFRSLNLYRAVFTTRWTKPEMILRSTSATSVRSVGTVGRFNTHLWWTEPSEVDPGAVLLAAPVSAEGLSGPVDTIARGIGTWTTHLSAALNDSTLVWLVATPRENGARIVFKNTVRGTLTVHDWQLSLGLSSLLVPATDQRLWLITDTPQSWTTEPPSLVVHGFDVVCR